MLNYVKYEVIIEKHKVFATNAVIVVFVINIFKKFYS